MSRFKLVPDYFLRKGWNETWHYPSTGSLIALDKDFPALSPFYFSWETNYVPLHIISFSRTHYWLGPFFSAVYLFFIFFGPKLMENRKPFDLKTSFKYWNLFLAVFSFWGAIRTLPHLLYYIWKVGFFTTLCTPPVWGFGAGAAGFWTMLFVYSKYVELIDTVFIILRKRSLSFLHWYHHATVLLYTWDAFVVEQPPGIYFCAMNYTVHAIMYFYYYLAAVSKPPKWGIIVTVLQISQMLIGVVVTCVSLYLSYKYRFASYTTIDKVFQPFDTYGCYLTRSNLIGCIMMYSTYFYLFAAFFLDRYIFKSKKKIQ